MHKRSTSLTRWWRRLVWSDVTHWVASPDRDAAWLSLRSAGAESRLWRWGRERGRPTWWRCSTSTQTSCWSTAIKWQGSFTLSDGERKASVFFCVFAARCEQPMDFTKIYFQVTSLHILSYAFPSPKMTSYLLPRDITNICECNSVCVWSWDLLISLLGERYWNLVKASFLSQSLYLCSDLSDSQNIWTKI